MNIIDLVVYIALAGFLVYIVTTIPMPAVFRNLIVGLACFAVVIWVLQSLGYLHGFLRLR